MAKVKPVDVVIENVVPAGGFTRPTEAKRLSEALKPFKTNPLASCEFVLYWKTLAGADVMDCPIKYVLKNKKNMVISFLIN